MGVNWSKSYNLLVDSWIYYQGTKRPYSSSRPYHPCSPGQTRLYKFSHQKMRWCDHDCCLSLHYSHLVSVAAPPRRDAQSVVAPELARVAWREIWRIFVLSRNLFSFQILICFRFRSLLFFQGILIVLVILASSRIINKCILKVGLGVVLKKLYLKKLYFLDS